MAARVLLCLHSTAQFSVTGIELAEINVTSKMVSLFGEKYGAQA
jgi:hypothetical protein